MKVLVACEFSQVVTLAFRAKGHEAYSCDLLPCEGGHPEWHFQEDIFAVLSREKFDLGIFHPPCTHLAVSGAAWFARKRENGKQAEGIALFMAFANCNIPRYCIENPVGIMSREWRTPDQIIQPYYFGDEFQKTTCLWLKNLPKLVHVKEDGLFAQATHVGRGEMVKFASGKVMPKWYAETRGDGHARSVTFPGIANAMATQWG